MDGGPRIRSLPSPTLGDWIRSARVFEVWKASLKKRVRIILWKSKFSCLTTYCTRNIAHGRNKFLENSNNHKHYNIVHNFSFQYHNTAGIVAADRSETGRSSIRCNFSEAVRGRTEQRRPP